MKKNLFLIAKKTILLSVLFTSFQAISKDICSSGNECREKAKELAKAEATFKESLPYYLKACEMKDEEGCVMAAHVYKYGFSDLAKAKTILSSLCAKKNSTGCYNLGNIEIQEKNLASAILHFRAACNSSFPLACMNLGIAYFRNGEKEKGITIQNDLCEKSFSPACFNLACYLSETNKLPESADALDRTITLNAQYKAKVFTDVQLANLLKSSFFEKVKLKHKLKP